jgi:hypothetical protein
MLKEQNQPQPPAGRQLIKVDFAKYSSAVDVTSYRGKFVAWSAKGDAILASGESPQAVLDALSQAGEENFVFDRISAD